MEVCCLADDGHKFFLCLHLDSTISEIRRHVAGKLGIDVKKLQIMIVGRYRLEDDLTLRDCCFMEGDTIRVSIGSKKAFNECSEEEYADIELKASLQEADVADDRDERERLRKRAFGKYERRMKRLRRRMRKKMSVQQNQPNLQFEPNLRLVLVGSVVAASILGITLCKFLSNDTIRMRVRN